MQEDGHLVRRLYCRSNLMTLQWLSFSSGGPSGWPPEPRLWVLCLFRVALRNRRGGIPVHLLMWKLSPWILGALLLSLAPGLSGQDLSARRKFALIASDRLKPGSVVDLTLPELNAYAQQEAALLPGVREPKLELPGEQTVVASAVIDFGEFRRGQGIQQGWLISQLLDGERPVRVLARIHSEGGTATVDVQKVEVSGVAIDGAALDFLIRNFLLPLYPSSVVGRPFELGHRMRKLDVGRAGVRVLIGD